MLPLQSLTSRDLWELEVSRNAFKRNSKWWVRSLKNTSIRVFSLTIFCLFFLWFCCPFILTPSTLSWRWTLEWLKHLHIHLCKKVKLKTMQCVNKTLGYYQFPRYSLNPELNRVLVQCVAIRSEQLENGHFSWANSLWTTRLENFWTNRNFF